MKRATQISQEALPLMLKCKDFHLANQQKFLEVSERWEPIESVLDRVNAWIGSERIRVLNVETISSGCVFSHLQSYIRVWYEE